VGKILGPVPPEPNIKPPLNQCGAF